MVCRCSVTQVGWQTMILTMMVMNAKSRGRKRVKMRFRSRWLLQLMNTRRSEGKKCHDVAPIWCRRSESKPCNLSARRDFDWNVPSRADFIYNLFYHICRLHTWFWRSDRILASFSLFGIRQNPGDKNKPGSSVFSEHVCFGICSQRHSFIAALAFGAELKKENKTTWWKYDI